MDSILPFYGFFCILIVVESETPFVVLLLAFFSWVTTAVAIASPLLVVTTVAPLSATAIVVPLSLLLL
jgi:hypothetical protein